MTVFTGVWMGLFMAIGLFLVLLATLLGMGELFETIMFPAALLMGAMFFSSIYFTYRDSFVAEGEIKP
jgi:hypothetical protein